MLVEDDFDERRKHSETVERSKGGTKLHSPLWADFFDFSIADEVHQLAGDMKFFTMMPA